MSGGNKIGEDQCFVVMGQTIGEGFLFSFLIILNKKNNIKVHEEGRYIIFKVEIQRGKMLLGNAYFPTMDKEKDLRSNSVAYRLCRN